MCIVFTGPHLPSRIGTTTTCKQTKEDHKKKGKTTFLKCPGPYHLLNSWQLRVCRGLVISIHITTQPFPACVHNPWPSLFVPHLAAGIHPRKSRFNVLACQLCRAHHIHLTGPWLLSVPPAEHRSHLDQPHCRQLAKNHNSIRQSASPARGLFAAINT